MNEAETRVEHRLVMDDRRRPGADSVYNCRSEQKSPPARGELSVLLVGRRELKKTPYAL
jgi:hypothetical protein